MNKQTEEQMLGNYYKLNPRDYSKIIGKCVRFTADGETPIFEFEYKDCGKVVNGSGAFDFYAVEELTVDELREYRLNKLLTKK